MPGERDALAKVIHQLLIHESWASRYGVVPGPSQLHAPWHAAAAADATMFRPSRVASLTAKGDSLVELKTNRAA